MASSDLMFTPAGDLAARVRGGELSSRELVQASLDRIDALDGELNAFVEVDAERALAAADEVQPGDLRPFAGVPIAIKANVPVEGLCMNFGSKFLAGHRPEHSAYLVRRLREAGFIVVGITNMPEFGILPTTEPRHTGVTRNPWDHGRTPGGSSGGSAAAVAAGMVPVAHGNDGGGSIRIPAAHCGLVGLKPSRGRISLGPDYGDVFTGLVNEGVLTRSVRDTAAILDAVMGSTPGDPYAAPPLPGPLVGELLNRPRALRVAVRTAPPGRQYETHPDCVEAAQVTGRLLESLGHGVEEVELPELDDPAITETFMVRWGAGAAWTLDYWSRKTGRTITERDVEPLTWALAEMGRARSAGDYLSAVEAHQRLAWKVADWQERSGFDLLLTPTTAEPAPVLGSFAHPPDQPLLPLVRATPFATFTAGMNMTGAPAISLPVHWNASGIPVGAQLVAPYGREDLLIGVAAQLEEAAPWAERTPPVFAAA